MVDLMVGLASLTVDMRVVGSAALKAVEMDVMLAG